MKTKSIKLTLLLIGMCAAIWSSPAPAQQITGTLVGGVYDAQGAMIPGATVKATNDDTGLVESATSSALGEYRIGNLPVGRYSLLVTKSGFKAFVQKNITLTVDQTEEVNVNLAVGEQTESITVSNAPPTINLSTSDVSREVGTGEILGLPLVNRNAYEELTLTPGVQASTTSANGAGATGGGNFVMGLPSQQTQINGGFDAGVGSVSYYLDGGNNMTGNRNYGNPIPNPDALQEFRVETSNYSAQYGRFSAGVITVLTKSGTNHFHGSLFEFARNTDFNATPWGQAVNTPDHRNQFGVTVGGPIIPDRTFFFFSYAGLRQTTSSILSGGIVPTALERAGNFSQSKILPIDPTTGAVYDYNATPGWIPPSDLDPTAANIINTYIPLANTPGNQWSGYTAAPYTDNEYLGKIDHQLSANNHLQGSYFTISSTYTANPGTNLPYSLETSTAFQQNVNINDTQTLSPSLVNQTWFTYVRVTGGRLDTPKIDLGDLGSSYTIEGPPALPALDVSGYFNEAQGEAGPMWTNNYSLRDIANKIIGKHSISFGGEMSLDKEMADATILSYGSFDFNTSAPDTTGNALADFVTGRPQQMEQDTPAYSPTNSWYYGMYLQDDYRMTPRLTVNLGLRYDLQTADTDPGNRQLTFEPGVQSTVVPSAPLGVIFVGDPGVSRGTISLRKHHLSPRLGFALDPFGNGKTSIRAAAGVFYGSISADEWFETEQSQPFAVKQVFTSIASLTNVYGDKTSFPNGDPFPYYYTPSNPRFLPAPSVAGNSLNFQFPYSYQVTTSVQQQVTNNLTAMIAYVGNFAHDVPFQNDVNYPAYAPGATTSETSENNRRPYDPGGALGDVQLQDSLSTGSYNALQISANKKMSADFSLTGFYVWSKSFCSSAPAGIGESGVQDYDDLSEDRGLCTIDRKNMASISGMWNIGYFHGTNRVLSGVLNGWQITPIVTLWSGAPLDISTGGDVNAGTLNYNRPNLVAGQIATLNPHRSRTQVAAEWFNKAAFTVNAPGQGIGPYGVDGDTPYDYLRSPGYRDVDLGLFRNFNLVENLKLQARAEAINAFNLVSLSAPNATLSSSAFGEITSAYPNRQIQLGLRLVF